MLKMQVFLQKAFWSFQLYCFNKRPFLLTALLFTCVLRISLLQKNQVNFILIAVFPSHFYPGCSGTLLLLFQHSILFPAAETHLESSLLSTHCPSISTTMTQMNHFLFLGSPEIMCGTLPIRLRTLSFRIHYAIHLVLVPSIINSHNYTAF